MGQGQTPRRYTKEFKQEAVELSMRPGVHVKQVAKDLGIPLHTLYSWRFQREKSGDDAFRGHGRRTVAEEELTRLKRRMAELEMENDILKKAAAFFARHQR